MPTLSASLVNPIVRNLIAVLAGGILGCVVNLGLVMVGILIVPLPEGVDALDSESVKAALPTMPAVAFLFPWLAHAMGTLTGAFVTAKVTVGPRRLLALAMGGFFLLGGILNLMSLPHPIWFAAADLIGAYLPMGWLGGLLAVGAPSESSAGKDSPP